MSLDEAWAAVEEALPKRWSVQLQGDWENGWEASATGRVLGGASWSVRTNTSGWFHEPGGYPTPAAALENLRSLLENPGGTE